MADKTFGVKVDEELYSDVKELIESSGKTSKEWFEQLITFAQIQQLKEGAGDFSQDIAELEVHTQRIYELSANMVNRATYMKDHAVKEVEKQLEETKEIAQGYKEKLNEQKGIIETAKSELDQAKAENEQLQQQLKESKSTNENNQLLIQEYKEKNDTLTGLVTQYKQHQVENEQLKQQLINQEQETATKVNELILDNQQKEQQLKSLEQQIEQLKQQHQIEVQQKVLEVKAEYQEKIERINEDHAKSLGEKMDMKMVADLFDQLKAEGKSNQSKPAPKPQTRKQPQKQQTQQIKDNQ